MEKTQHCCPKCGKEVENKRKKYCSDSCKYWYNQIKKDNESHLPPVRKRNANYFFMTSHISFHKGSGKRFGSMISGSMGAMIPIAHSNIVELNQENVAKHFQGIAHWNYKPNYLKLGNQVIIKKEDVFEKLGFKID